MSWMRVAGMMTMGLVGACVNAPTGGPAEAPKAPASTAGTTAAVPVPGSGKDITIAVNGCPDATHDAALFETAPQKAPLLQKACENGDAEGCTKLASFEMCGVGMPRDTDKA